MYVRDYIHMAWQELCAGLGIILGLFIYDNDLILKLSETFHEVRG